MKAFRRTSPSSTSTDCVINPSAILKTHSSSPHPEQMSSSQWLPAEKSIAISKFSQSMRQTCAVDSKICAANSTTLKRGRQVSFCASRVVSLGCYEYQHFHSLLSSSFWHPDFTRAGGLALAFIGANPDLRRERAADKPCKSDDVRRRYRQRSRIALRQIQ